MVWRLGLGGQSVVFMPILETERESCAEADSAVLYFIDDTHIKAKLGGGWQRAWTEPICGGTGTVNRGGTSLIRNYPPSRNTVPDGSEEHQHPCE